MAPSFALIRKNPGHHSMKNEIDFLFAGEIPPQFPKLEILNYQQDEPSRNVR